MMDARQFSTGAGVGLGVLLISGALLFVAPPWSDLSRLGGRTELLRDELSRPASDPELIERLSAELERLRALGASGMTPIPESSDVASLVRELSMLLESIGLREREITTGAPRELAEASAMPMSVMVRGGFPAIAEAVRRIESLPRLVRVQRLRVSRDTGGSSGPDWSGEEVRADLMIEVFFAPRSVASAGDAGEG